MHGSTKDDAKIAKINALSAEVFEDTKDVKRIQKGLSQVKVADSDDEDDSAADMKSNKKKALALEKKEEKENKKKAIELEKEEEKQDKENKKKAVELEKAEEGDTDSDEGAGSSGRITKILKMLEEEIVARSSKDSDPPAEPEKPEKPCKDGMSELKKYFSGKEGVKRSKVFIKFAKLLTGGDDDVPESTAQVPQLAAVAKPKQNPAPIKAPIEDPIEGTEPGEAPKDDQEDEEPSVNLIQKKHKALKKKYSAKKKKTAVKKQHKKKPEEQDLVSIAAGPKGSKGGISL